MADEIKKVETPPQAPAEGAPKTEEKPKVDENKPGPSGLDALTPAALKDLYKRSPQMFEEAGIVKEVAAPPEKKPEPPIAPAASAAPKPKYGDAEISLPEDVKVDRSAVDAYLAHAKEIGLNAKQVQAEIDFQTKQAREAMARQTPPPKVPTPEEIDAANVVKLKAKWGEKYEENMEAARRAAVKFAGTKMLGKLTTSDPDLVEHFLTLAGKDAEDKTLRAPNRSGEEGNEAADEEESYLKRRYNHPTSQSMFK